MSKAHHFVPPLLVLFLGCTALSGGAQAGWFDLGSSNEAKTASQAAKDQAPKNKPATPSAGATLDESIRQAQLLRLAGNYQEAVKHLSQLMMVAADDPRVVGEYGKSLAMMGRASDAVNFLSRAEQLQPTDWSIYSALGVAYDQVGNQKQAQAAYEHALALRPGEPSVLNNYALSRLMAKDTEMARVLAGRAEAANTTKDDKIIRNIAMIRSMAPEKAAPSIAANKPAPQTPAPQSSVAHNFAPPAQQPIPLQKVTQTALPAPSAPKPDNRVVMQRVPVDPLAGPVAKRAPRPLQEAAKTDITKSETAKTEIAKTETAKMAAAPVKPVAAVEKPKADVKAEPVAAKPAAKPEVVPVKTELKAVAKPEAKTAEVKPAAGEAKTVVKADVKSSEVKTADSKPLPSAKAVVNLDALPAPRPDTKAPAPKVLPPTMVKAASAKPAAKPETKPEDKNAIPGLRLSANAY